MSKRIILFLFLSLVVLSAEALAQTTEFLYQGRLSEAGSPVTGTRFFRFTLFDENGAANLSNTTTIGANAKVTQSNSVREQTNRLKSRR